MEIWGKCRKMCTFFRFTGIWWKMQWYIMVNQLHTRKSEYSSFTIILDCCGIVLSSSNLQLVGIRDLLMDCFTQILWQISCVLVTDHEAWTSCLLGFLPLTHTHLRTHAHPRAHTRACTTYRFVISKDKNVGTHLGTTYNESESTTRHLRGTILVLYIHNFFLVSLCKSSF